jgi:hypothetical protein
MANYFPILNIHADQYIMARQHSCHHMADTKFLQAIEKKFLDDL